MSLSSVQKLACVFSMFVVAVYMEVTDTPQVGDCHQLEPQGSGLPSSSVIHHHRPLTSAQTADAVSVTVSFVVLVQGRWG